MINIIRALAAVLGRVFGENDPAQTQVTMAVYDDPTLGGMLRAAAIVDANRGGPQSPGDTEASKIITRAGSGS